MTSGVDCSNGEENLDGSLLCTEEDAQQHPRQKLFDLSSSSSDGENTEDEEFVELLGKYYDLVSFHFIFGIITNPLSHNFYISYLLNNSKIEYKEVTVHVEISFVY